MRRDEMKARRLAEGSVGAAEGRDAGASTASAQQPHVTQIGGQAPSSEPSDSPPIAMVQGSAVTRLVTPETLNVRTATKRAKATRCKV